MLESAYIAGIIDGEGCIRLAWARSTVFPQILIVNTNLKLLNILQEIYGGDIHEQKNAARRGWKRSYQWRLSWSRAVDLLDEVYPFLIIKREQAETVFAWQECRHGRGREFNLETKSFLLSRMKWLNCKGPQQGDDPAIAAAGEYNVS